MAPSTSVAHKRTASSTPEASKQPATKAAKSTEDKSPTASADIDSNEESADTASPKAKDAVAVDPKPSTLQLTSHIGDIFAAPEGAVLIHACNTQGSWGAGIAAAFRTKYPEAFKRYRDHCLVKHKPNTSPVPTGTCLLIPPCERDPKKPKHWIGCLFTSARYGKGKDKPDIILKNTGPAVEDLLQQLKEVNEKGDGTIGELRMCRINSARFGVPWGRTVEVLEGVTAPEGSGELSNIEVWDRE